MPPSKHFSFVPFSKKQKKVLSWWLHPTFKDYDAIIADGSIRSGKTLVMSISFVMWSMSTFKSKNLGMCGKTVGSFKRNVWVLLKTILQLRGYKIRKLSDVGDNAYAIRKGPVENYYYIFGGRDERSQDIIQGFTAAGFLFDEVVLMPKSFVMQAIGRCSETGAKLWFNCNPDSPYHWFKLEWIDMAKEKKALHINFLLDDNPSLTEDVKDKYKRRFVGLFYQRFILGLWVLAEGIIYSMFDRTMILNKLPPGVKINRHWVSIDYGQSNATVFIHIGMGSDNRLYILNEYYHEGRTTHIQKSPAKYSKDYFKWLEELGVHEVNDAGMLIKYPLRPESIYIDPSAKGFMLQLFEDGEKRIRQADNEVKRGIELVSSIIDNDMFRVLAHCKHTINELSSYCWDPKAQERGEDKPIKQNDHCMDALRYCVNGNRKMWQHLVITRIKAA